MSDASASLVPSDSRKLRACLLCSLVKSALQFRKDGCENCEPILRIKGSADRVSECTTAQFHGLVALMRPGESWVSRWQRIPDTVTQGIYAISVTGSLPDAVLDLLERRGVTYK
ncbi:Transcription elongation factor SPT4 [Mitosporidium daphniae]|uniref:Transcription elongation factor SPT4 n=1 Tax=Mitosporidium daphniae TaxID=1485682 RepID=A0A098VQG1_9MICR|nr:transcription elongation factor Spt4 [Mitosporidium daphniae]KGG51215.1 transcription elongation factor Spt4 [Mitosporidium daphniae]|eukprot:XP_013237660.1 transcription elongation factor Spt4 [Mitosporidium daphniae]